MPYLQKQITIFNTDQYPSNGSIVLEILVDEFLAACNQEEKDWLKEQLNQPEEQAQGIRPLTDEEIKAFGLDKLDPTPTPPAKKKK